MTQSQLINHIFKHYLCMDRYDPAHICDKHLIEYKDIANIKPTAFCREYYYPYMNCMKDTSKTEKDCQIYLNAYIGCSKMRNLKQDNF